MNPKGDRIGIIGGSGFYSLFENGSSIEVDTPYGSTSGEIVKETLDGRKVFFLSRHGANHKHMAHRVPYRANLWALKSLGINQILSLNAVGSLKQSLKPGTFGIPSQVVDRTKNRISTFCEQDNEVIHISFADPFCPNGNEALSKACSNSGNSYETDLTMVVIEGPRFSSRAESVEFSSNGWDLVGMTGMPEATLARELGMCYSSLSLVTDFDAGTKVGDGVSQDEILQKFAASLPKMKEIVLSAVSHLTTNQIGCQCNTVFEISSKPSWMP